MVLKQLDGCVEKSKSHPTLSPYTQSSSKWILDLDVQPKSIKFLEEDMRLYS